MVFTDLCPCSILFNTRKSSDLLYSYYRFSLEARHTVQCSIDHFWGIDLNTSY